MIPSIDERLASVVRALGEVIIPHLPSNASLAREQAQLAIGHLQIIRATLDLAPEYEREELADAIAVGKALTERLGSAGDGLSELAATLATANGTDVRAERQAIYDAVERVVKEVSNGGDQADAEAMQEVILKHEAKRLRKDREWFAPFGFDTL